LLRSLQIQIKVFPELDDYYQEAPICADTSTC
jgi:hypothetical protein